MGAAGPVALSAEAGVGATIRATLSEASMVVDARALSGQVSSEAADVDASLEAVATSALVVTTAVSEVVTGTSGGYLRVKMDGHDSRHDGLTCCDGLGRGLRDHGRSLGGARRLSNTVSGGGCGIDSGRVGVNGMRRSGRRVVGLWRRHRGLLAHTSTCSLSRTRSSSLTTRHNNENARDGVK